MERDRERPTAAGPTTNIRTDGMKMREQEEEEEEETGRSEKRERERERGVVWCGMSCGTHSVTVERREVRPSRS